MLTVVSAQIKPEFARLTHDDGWQNWEALSDQPEFVHAVTLWQFSFQQGLEDNRPFCMVFDQESGCPGFRCLG